MPLKTGKLVDLFPISVLLSLVYAIIALSETMEFDESTSEGSGDLPDNVKSMMKEETSMASNESGTDALKQESSDGQLVNANQSHKRWSELLQSPRGTECFSPSLDLSKPDSLHGIGTCNKSLQKLSTRFLVFVIW